MSGPTVSDELAKARMRRDAYQDTAAERGIQDLLKANDIAFTLRARTEEAARPNKEIVIESARVVMLVSGCFLHGCEKHSRKTKSSTKWWADKIEQNQQRDAESRRLWQAEGWEVVEVWEHEDPEDSVRHISEVMSASMSSATAAAPAAAG